MVLENKVQPEYCLKHELLQSTYRCASVCYHSLQSSHHRWVCAAKLRGLERSSQAASIATTRRWQGAGQGGRQCDGAFAGVRVPPACCVFCVLPASSSRTSLTCCNVHGGHHMLRVHDSSGLKLRSVQLRPSCAAVRFAHVRLAAPDMLYCCVGGLSMWQRSGVWYWGSDAC